MAALACLSWLLFLRLSKAPSIIPASVVSDSVVTFLTTKVGGHREVRMPIYWWERYCVRFLRAYDHACCILEGQALVRVGVVALQKT